MDESDNIYNVYCGKLDYVLANDQEKNVAQFADTLGWRSAKKPGKVPYSVEPFHFDQSASEEDNYDQFGQAIVAAAKQSGKKEIFLCVHGFNNSFAVAAGKATDLPIMCSVRSFYTVGRRRQDYCNTLSIPVTTNGARNTSTG